MRVMFVEVGTGSDMHGQDAMARVFLPFMNAASFIDEPKAALLISSICTVSFF